MNKEQDGGFPPFSVLDTALSPTYTMSEGIKDNLSDLIDAFATVGQLAEAAEHGAGPVVTLSSLAPLHRSLSSFGKRLMADMTPRFPTLRGPAAQ